MGITIAQSSTKANNPTDRQISSPPTPSFFPVFEPSQVLGASLARWMRERGGTATQAAGFLLEVLQAWVLSRWGTHTGTAARWSRTFTLVGFLVGPHRACGSQLSPTSCTRGHRTEGGHAPAQGGHPSLRATQIWMEAMPHMRSRSSCEQQAHPPERNLDHREL